MKGRKLRKSALIVVLALAIVAVMIPTVFADTKPGSKLNYPDVSANATSTPYNSADWSGVSGNWNQLVPGTWVAGSNYNDDAYIIKYGARSGLAAWDVDLKVEVREQELLPQALKLMLVVDKSGSMNYCTLHQFYANDANGGSGSGSVVHTVKDLVDQYGEAQVKEWLGVATLDPAATYTVKHHHGHDGNSNYYSCKLIVSSEKEVVLPTRNTALANATQALLQGLVDDGVTVELSVIYFKGADAYYLGATNGSTAGKIPTYNLKTEGAVTTVVNALANVRASGNTPVPKAMQTARDANYFKASATEKQVLILLTDGVTNVGSDADAVAAATTLKNNQRVDDLYTVGFMVNMASGSDSNTLFSSVASSGEHIKTAGSTLRLIEVFEEIKDEIAPMVHDPLHEWLSVSTAKPATMTVVPADAAIVGGAFTHASGNTISWSASKVPEKSILHIKYTADLSDAWKAATLGSQTTAPQYVYNLPLNRDAQLTYTVKSDKDLKPGSLNFPLPVGRFETGSLAVGYELDDGTDLSASYAGDKQDTAVRITDYYALNGKEEAATTITNLVPDAQVVVGDTTYVYHHSEYRLAAKGTGYHWPANYQLEGTAVAGDQVISFNARDLELHNYIALTGGHELVHIYSEKPVVPGSFTLSKVVTVNGVATTDATLLLKEFKVRVWNNLTGDDAYDKELTVDAYNKTVTETVAPGTYYFQEVLDTVAHDGYTFNGVAYNPNDAAVEAPNPARGTFTVVEEGQAAVVVSNDYLKIEQVYGYYTLEKLVQLNDKSPSGTTLVNKQFNLSVTNEQGQSRVISLKHDQVTEPIQVPVGTYTVVELNGDDNYYQFEGVTFSGGDGTVTGGYQFTVVAGEAASAIAITATNDYHEALGSFTLTKEVLIDGATPEDETLLDQEFSIRVVGPNGYDQTFAVSENAPVSETDIPAGIYYATEDVSGAGIPGYTFLGCEFAPQNGVFTVTDDGHVTVLATNRYSEDIPETGWLELQKAVYLDGDITDNTVFTNHPFRVEVSSASAGYYFVATISANKSVTLEVPVADDYQIRELDSNREIDGYDFDRVEYSASGNIAVLPGEESGITVRNFYETPEPEVGSLVVSKTVSGLDTNQSFSFTVIGPAEFGSVSFTLQDGQSRSFDNLEPGEYTVIESLDNDILWIGDYELVEVNDGNNQIVRTVLADQTVYADFTNYYEYETSTTYRDRNTSLVSRITSNSTTNTGTTITDLDTPLAGTVSSFPNVTWGDPNSTSIEDPGVPLDQSPFTAPKTGDRENLLLIFGIMLAMVAIGGGLYAYARKK